LFFPVLWITTNKKESNTLRRALADILHLKKCHLKNTFSRPDGVRRCFSWSPRLQAGIGPLLRKHVEHGETIVVTNQEKTVP
jgi:hypothetical protein